jgi:hypothetical protein
MVSVKRRCDEIFLEMKEHGFGKPQNKRFSEGRQSYKTWRAV